MLTADFTSEMEQFREGLPKSGDYTLGLDDRLPLPPPPPGRPPAPPTPPAPKDILLPELEQEPLRPEMMTHELRTSRLFEMIENGGHEPEQPGQPSPAKGLFADGGDVPRRTITEGSGALFGAGTGQGQEPPSSYYATKRVGQDGVDQPQTSTPLIDFPNEPILGGPAATAPSSLARSTVVDPLPSKTPGSSFLDQSTGVLGDVSGPGADQFFAPDGHNTGVASRGQPIAAFATMSRFDVIRDMIDRRWFTTMLVGALAVLVGVVGWAVLIVDRGDGTTVVADDNLLPATTLLSRTGTLASSTTLPTSATPITTATIPVTEAPSTTRDPQGTTAAPTSSVVGTTDSTASTTSTTASTTSTTASTTSTTASTTSTTASTTSTTASTTSTTADATTTTA
ncbi:MAG: hypothetical protein GY724_13040 [Actinomycetia bacterium]|nr:hypothetical protein [Actinomycetes bacterium]